MARNLRRLIAARGISVRMIADRAGVATSLVYDALEGLRGISIDAVGNLADALECDPRDLWA